MAHHAVVTAVRLVAGVINHWLAKLLFREVDLHFLLCPCEG